MKRLVGKLVKGSFTSIGIPYCNLFNLTACSLIALTSPSNLDTACGVFLVALANVAMQKKYNYLF